MNSNFWVIALWVATAGAYKDSESRPLYYPEPVDSTVQCGCKAIQFLLEKQEQRIALQHTPSTELDQLENRVSQLLELQQIKIQSILDDHSTKVDQLDDRVSQMLDQQQTKAQFILDSPSAKLDQLEDRVSQMFTELQNRTNSVNEGYSSAIDQLENRISQMIEQLNENITKLMQNHTHQSVSSSKVPVNYIDTKFGSHWIVMLERIDGSVSFERPWAEYRDGFGTEGKNFWLGLEKVHQLTKDAPHELVVEMKDSKGDERYARYATFEIGSEGEYYPISKLGTHSGSAGDGLSIHLKRTFSTYNGGKDVSTSQYYGNGGWWFYGTWDSYLTGRHGNGDSWNGIWWGQFKPEERWTKLKYVRMMIRAL